MKNPLSTTTPFWLTRELSDTVGSNFPTLSPALPSGLSALQLMLLGQPGVQLLDKKDKEPSTLGSILEFAKYSPDQIARIVQFADIIGKLAGTVSWAVGAFTTVKNVLTLLGVLDQDNTSLTLLRSIDEKVQAIYSYLEGTEKKTQYELALNWRTKVQAAQTGIHNLALSRTQSNLDDLANSITDMMENAILPMLGLGTGTIPFMRTTYGGQPTYSKPFYFDPLPVHWTAYARPLWMQTTDGKPVTIGDYPDLQSLIWDPGYYLDVLIDAIGVLIASLTALEPAFRSTAFDRPYLRDIASGLSAFIDKWERSMLITNVVGPLDPAPGHAIHHPWAGDNVLDPPGLPIGAIDPVTGVTAFDPLWREGFDMIFDAWPGPPSLTVGPAQGWWRLRNYDQVVAAAYAYRASLLAQVHEQCGINRLRALRDSVAALIGPPYPSEFVSLADPAFSRADIAGQATTVLRDSGTDEEVDLGIIGQFAGKPGKKYKARRWYQYTIKSFRVPMARRMDYSGTQLGYRFRFTVGQASQGLLLAPAAIDYSSVITDFTAEAFPGQVLELFPSEPKMFDLQSDSAGVYDVLQSGRLGLFVGLEPGVFSQHEEELFENTGQVPGKPRLYLEKGDGRTVSARAKIEFEFDVKNPDSPFVGFATVTVGNVDPEAHRDGFILDFEVYETADQAPEDPPRDERREQAAGRMRLHFAPSFLVVEPDYFTDRDAGLKAIAQAIQSVARQYVRSKLTLGPSDPIESIQRVGQEQERIVSSFAEYARLAPEAADQLKNQYAVPA